MSRLRPVFIVGAARSGTTLLQQMMDHHPKLAFPWESFFIPVFARRLYHYGDLGIEKNRRRLIEDISEFLRSYFPHSRNLYWCKDLKESAGMIAHATPAQYPAIVDAIFQHCLKNRRFDRWCDKTPIYVKNMPLLLQLFPEAKFVHIIRDGRDVAASILPLSFGPNSIYVAAKKWKETIECARGFELKHPEHIIQIRYEDLVSDPEPILRETCVFIEEDYAEQMLAYHEDSLTRVPDAGLHKTVSEPVTARQIDRWKKDLSLKQIELYEAVAGDALARCGYRLSTSSRVLRPSDKVLGRVAHYMGTLRRFSSIRMWPSRIESLWARTRFAGK